MAAAAVMPASIPGTTPGTPGLASPQTSANSTTPNASASISVNGSTRTSETLTDKENVSASRLSGSGKPQLQGSAQDLRQKPKSKRNSLLFRRNSQKTADVDDKEDVELDHSVSPGRVKTFTKSFKYLCNLTPKQVDEFMASYVIYNLDWADEAKMIEALGPDYQKKVGDCLKSYYGVLNHLCALGDVEKMYIPPAMNMKVSVIDNQLLYEESIARDLGLKPGMKVLDLGCGRGRVAAQMTKYSGAHITGLNIDPNSIAQARQWNNKLGYSNDFVIKDFNDLPLPFEDESFDAFYNIQAFSLVKDPKALFKELFRIMKPGARFSSLDWVKYPAYDENNPEHAELMRRTKPLIGAVGTPTPASLEEDLREAGFRVTKSDNASTATDGFQYPLIDKVDIYFRSVRKVILALCKMHVLPPHFKTLINRLCLDGQAFVKMDEMKLITTSYRIIAEKPVPESSEKKGTSNDSSDSTVAS